MIKFIYSPQPLDSGTEKMYCKTIRQNSILEISDFFPIFCLSLTAFSVTTIMATAGHVTEGNENKEQRGKLLH